jgi:LmbE family N-acetylglucosaminyl deacetylase
MGKRLAASAASALAVAGLIWAAGALYATDRSVPAVEPTARGTRRVLAVFPHADDETVSCGGTLHRLARAGCHVTLVVLTRGERGNPAGEPSLPLAGVRVEEARQAAAALGVARLVQHDLGDGELAQHRPQLARVLAEEIARTAPDLVITHDPTGVYGHEDHVACSDAVTEVCRTRFPGVTLWYAALPARLHARVGLDPSLEPRRTPPTHRVWIGTGLVAKVRAWYGYRSQRRSLREGLPPLVPAWVALSMLPFEHFAEAVATHTQ